MDSGLYSTYSGLRANADMLEVLSNNLANLNTTGYKADESFFRLYNRAVTESQRAPLDRAINDSAVVQGSYTSFVAGPVTTTGRDLDVALEGVGFFVVETPAGTRYTRNGNFHVSSDRHLVTSEGYPVLGRRKPIELPIGKVDISQSGEIHVNGAPVDALKIVAFDDNRALQKVGNSLFQLGQSGVSEKETKDVAVRQGSLEQSNVNPVQQMIMIINMMRQFEGLQKAMSTVMNTVNDRSVNQVGRPIL